MIAWQMQIERKRSNSFYGFSFFHLPTCVSKTRPHKSEFAITDKIRQEMIRIVKANWIGPVLAIDW